MHKQGLILNEEQPQAVKSPTGNGFSPDLSETPSVPDDSLEWKYLLARRAGGAFPGVPAEVCCAVVTFPLLRGFCAQTVNGADAVPASSRGSAPLGTAAGPRLSLPLTFHC